MNEKEVYAQAKKKMPQLVEIFEELQRHGVIATKEGAEAAAGEVCILCTDASSAVTGSLQARCSCCHQIVWLAPSTQEILEKRGKKLTTLLCLKCADKWL